MQLFLPPYGVNISSGQGCTFDYFAWSQTFLTHHGDAVAESGVALLSEFQSLRRAVITRQQDDPSIAELRSEVRNARGDDTAAAVKTKLSRARVVHVAGM